MKNIHILPTDKPSRLHFDGNLFLSPNYQDSKTINSIVEGKHIYITSDEEIKEGDWYAYFIVDKVSQSFTTKLDCVVKADLNKTNEYLVEPFSKYCKKIILTTDFKLAPDVQKIDDEFLEWFVKNSSCEEVEVELEIGSLRWSDSKNTYKIIIPKEEPKQTVQEYEQQGLEKYSNELVEPKQETIEKEMIENMVELLKEDIECVHMYLDDKQVPRQNDNGSKYSIIGRIKKLEASFQKQLSELESYYLTKSK